MSEVIHVRAPSRLHFGLFSRSAGGTGANNAYIGGGAVSNGGAGTLTITGGVMNVGGTVKVWNAGSIINLSGGTNDAAADAWIKNSNTPTADSDAFNNGVAWVSGTTCP